ncbi:hypothetical protein [Halorhodospira halochloris]|nr:hypothetical protein [Halorhodospira halochloris]
MTPSLEASWRHPRRQNLHTWKANGSGEVLEAAQRLLSLCGC